MENTESDLLFPEESLHDITPTSPKETKRKGNKNGIKRSTITITCSVAEKKKILKAAIDAEENVSKYILRKVLR